MRDPEKLYQRGYLDGYREESRCPACGAIAEQHLFTSYSGDKDWRCPEPESMIENATDEEYQRAADSITDEPSFYPCSCGAALSKEEYKQHRQMGHDNGERFYPYRDSVSDEKPKTFGGIPFIVDENVSHAFNDSPVLLNLRAFYIDDDNRLWAKTDKGDELVSYDNHRHEDYERDNTWLDLGVTTQGPCSCLAHRTENCSDCFPVPNPSFGFDELGPSDLPPGFGDGVIAIVDDGPSNDEEYEVLGQMTVEQMMATVADITETIYPNQSASLLPKFELVLRAVFENADDAVNIG